MRVDSKVFWAWFVLFSAVAFDTTTATAQISWEVTHESTIDTNSYVISVLGGSGKFFTASARKTASANIGLSFIFLRSNDGGMTWTEQSSGLPYDNLANHDDFDVLDQIDSLNVIAGSKYGLILRTFNGGATWEPQLAGDSLYPIGDINFSDPLNGILIKGGYENQTWETSDGGRNWEPSPFHAIVNQCQTTGHGHYRVFGYGNGPLYRTDDNWVTVDTSYVSDSLSNPNKVLGYCDFGSDDLVFAYGSNWTSPGPRGLIARTSDGGKTWADTTISYFNNISAMSDPDRDTIVAGGESGNYLLISTDRGLTWVRDSIILSENVDLGFLRGVSLTTDENIVAAFDDLPILGSGWLVVGTFSNSEVSHDKASSGEVSVFPNPATQSINLSAFPAGVVVHILDILGRDVLRATFPKNGRLTLEVSGFPAGFYFVTDGHLSTQFLKE